MQIVTDGRLCKVCGGIFPEAQFRYLKDGRLLTCRPCEAVAARGYYQASRVKILEQKKQWRIDNPDKAKSLDKVRYSRYGSTPKTRKQMDSSNALKRQKYWADVEKSREAQRQYCAANRERRRISNYRRRVRLYEAQGSHSKNDVARIYKSQSGKCYWCSAKLNGQYEIDHIIALSRGGSNGPENICCSCQPCNRSKNNRPPWIFNGRLL